MRLVGLAGLRYPFGGVPAGGPAPAAADFRTALRLRLLAEVPALEEVYWGSAGSGKAYPFLVINQLGPDRITPNTSASYYYERDVQFSVVSDDDEQSEGLAIAAQDALFSREDNAELVFEEGYDMARYPDALWPAEKQPGRGPRGVELWMAHFDATFLIGRTNPD